MFDKLIEQINTFSYSSWLEIEHQCSTTLSKIDKEMKDELKHHNVDSVCDQIDNYVYENIAKESL